jgi:large subunit ribosomal protein L15
MLKLNEIKPASGSVKKSKRLGRGIGSGTGKTAGRGHKGAGSRSGTTKKLYFEGGQTPLTRRLPKKGFNSFLENKFQIVNIADILKKENIDKEITPEWLYENKLIKSKNQPVKILGNGECNKTIIIKAHAFSKSAKEKIEKIKGKAEVISK